MRSLEGRRLKHPAAFVLRGMLVAQGNVCADNRIYRTGSGEAADLAARRTTLHLRLKYGLRYRRTEAIVITLLSWRACDLKPGGNCAEFDNDAIACGRCWPLGGILRI